MPPPRGALQFHLKEALHQFKIWVTADKAQLDQRDQNLCAWMLRNNKLVPRTVDVNIASKDLGDLISYNCKGI